MMQLVSHQLSTWPECRLEEDTVASKLLVNATAQACGLGRISNADLGLRQSEHVQVGLPTHACRSTLLCRHGFSTKLVLLLQQSNVPAYPSMGRLHIPAWGALRNPGQSAQHGVPTDAGKLACVARCLYGVLPDSLTTSSKAMCPAAPHKPLPQICSPGLT